MVAVFLMLSVGVLWMAFFRGGSGGPITGQYFYDLSTGKLVAVPSESFAPIKLDNGHEAVEAVIYACETCPSSITLKHVAYVMRLKSEARRKVPVDATVLDFAMFDDRAWEVADLDAAKEESWLALTSPEGIKMKQEAESICGEGKRPRRCWVR